MELGNLWILTIIIVMLSGVSPVKAELGDTIASLILFILIASFIFAGIGWWQKRQEKE
jgi:amino acid permease